MDIADHTKYFAGYMDAVARLYTNEEVLCGMNANLIPEGESVETQLSCSVVESSETSDMVRSFQESISNLLHDDTKKRILFYLIEYFSWYKEFSESCVCTTCKLEVAEIPERHAAYLLNLNNKFNVLVYMFSKKQRFK